MVKRNMKSFVSNESYLIFIFKITNPLPRPSLPSHIGNYDMICGKIQIPVR